MQKSKARPSPASRHLRRNSTGILVSGLLKLNISQDRKTDKKETIKRQVSLHRFKPVIFSKMIQNCLNQVEVRGYRRLVGSGVPPPPPGCRTAGLSWGQHSNVPAREAESAGPGWQRLESVRFSLCLFPQGCRSLGEWLESPGVNMGPRPGTCH